MYWLLDSAQVRDKYSMLRCSSGNNPRIFVGT